MILSCVREYSPLVTQPRIAELDYVADTPRRFRAFAHAPWCVLLDSGRPDSRRGRFEIFSAELCDADHPGRNDRDYNASSYRTGNRWSS